MIPSTFELAPGNLQLSQWFGEFDAPNTEGTCRNKGNKCHLCTNPQLHTVRCLHWRLEALVLPLPPWVPAICHVCVPLTVNQTFFSLEDKSSDFQVLHLLFLGFILDHFLSSTFQTTGAPDFGTPTVVSGSLLWLQLLEGLNTTSGLLDQLLVVHGCLANASSHDVNRWTFHVIYCCCMRAYVTKHKHMYVYIYIA